MNDVLRPFLHRFALTFFYDILIYNLSWLGYLCHVHFVLAKLQENRLFIKKSKCAFGRRLVAYLGHAISCSQHRDGRTEGSGRPGLADSALCSHRSGVLGPGGVLPPFRQGFQCDRSTADTPSVQGCLPVDC
jgi:hypothetical protein